ncbi:hypothetical protein BCV69DRAFT_161842 [Microstroma glucosiphilum]|uniref:Uncharacterized protein n=1 Tax=Pseudomicrostroma glucosiphilum TaxID=1684307 RepID=A0A316UAX0_9BASI|nr:hypothetical protein BCV69DRAFT_161842 [Pseudomicrostroma glucosiphilum]PWN21998.1 hypothetical protein BCV69DRAFT_161842 [Pseudomicrostroma glucosiphilum]
MSVLQPSVPPSPTSHDESEVRDHILLMRQAKQRQQLAALTEALALDQLTSGSSQSSASSPASTSVPPQTQSRFGKGRGLEQIGEEDPRLLSWYAASTEAESDSEADQPSKSDEDRAGSRKGHSRDDSTSGEENAVLGQQTIAALLSSSPVLPTRALKVPASDLTSADSAYKRNSAGSAGSSGESRRTHASLSHSPATSFSEGRRSDSRSSSRASFTPITSPKGPPPRDPLPALPSNGMTRQGSYPGPNATPMTFPRRRSDASPSTLQVPLPLDPPLPPPSGPLPDLPEGGSRSRPTSWQRPSSTTPVPARSLSGDSPTSSRQSFISARSGTDGRRSSITSALGQYWPSSPASQLSSFSTADDGAIRRSTDSSNWTAGLSGPEDPELTDRVSASRLQDILDAAEVRRRDIARRSLGGSSIQVGFEDVAGAEDQTADAWASGTSLAGPDTEKALQATGQETSATALTQTSYKTDLQRQLSNSRIVSMYETPPDTPDEQDPSRQQTPTPPVQSGSNNKAVNQSMVEDEEDVDSDDTISGIDVSGDGPRRKMQRRRGKSTSRTSFDYDAQRASAPSLRKGKGMQARTASGGHRAGLAPPSTPPATNGEEGNPFAFYAFSPDLPPFVPQGLRPLDLTGRGTWTSIAARAGAMTSPGSAALSRASSYASTVTAGQRSSYTSQNNSPVSMRQLAAEARLKQQQADEYRDQQAALLAGKSWKPFDIIAHATEHGLSSASSSATPSLYSNSGAPDASPRSHLSALSAPFPNGLAPPILSSSEGIAYHFDPYAHLRRDSHAKTEASVGMDDDEDFASFIAKRKSVKQYREFSQQTSPPPSPGPSRNGVLAEAGVGTDAEGDVPAELDAGGVGTDQRRSRKSAALTNGIRDIDSYYSSSEDEVPIESRTSAKRRSQRTSDHRRRRTTSGQSGKGRSVLIEDNDMSWPKPVRTPRLSSRRSNIFTTPVRIPSSAASHRSSSLSLRDDASQADVHQLEEEDGSSDESDLDLKTPITELAARTGAFDATVQNRGAKRKAAVEVQLPVDKTVPVAEDRPIAGTTRVMSHTSPRRVVSSPVKASPMRKAERGEANLLQSMAALSVAPATRPVGLGRRAASFDTASSRSASPDLDESFAADVNSDDDNVSLMLSEVDFPYATNAPSPRSDRFDVRTPPASPAVRDPNGTPRIGSVRVKSIASSIFGSVDTPPRPYDSKSDDESVIVDKPTTPGHRPVSMALGDSHNAVIEGAPSEAGSSSGRVSATTNTTSRSTDGSPPSSGDDAHENKARFSMATTLSSSYTEEATTPPPGAARAVSTGMSGHSDDGDFFSSAHDPARQPTTPKQGPQPMLSPGSPGSSLGRRSVEPFDRVLNARSPLSMLLDSGHRSSVSRSSSIGSRSPAGPNALRKGPMASPLADRGLPGGGLRKSASFACAIPPSRLSSDQHRPTGQTLAGAPAARVVSQPRVSAPPSASGIPRYSAPTAAPPLQMSATSSPVSGIPRLSSVKSQDPSKLSPGLSRKSSGVSVRSGNGTVKLVPAIIPSSSLPRKATSPSGSTSTLSSPVSPASTIVPMRATSTSPVSPPTTMVSRIPRPSVVSAGGAGNGIPARKR